MGGGGGGHGERAWAGLSAAGAEHGLELGGELRNSVNLLKFTELCTLKG